VKYIFNKPAIVQPFKDDDQIITDPDGTITVITKSRQLTDEEIKAIETNNQVKLVK
jgi:hypothetical protein